MKPHVWSLIQPILPFYIKQAAGNPKLSNHLFGTLANLCLRTPELAQNACMQFPSIIALAERTLLGAKKNDRQRVQVLQFLRILGKTENIAQFFDALTDLHQNCVNPVVRRIADEIIHARKSSLNEDIS